MVYSTEGFTNNSPIYPIKSTPVKKPRYWKALCMFANVIEVKKTAYRQVEATKSKRKEIKFGNTP